MKLASETGRLRSICREQATDVDGLQPTVRNVEHSVLPPGR